jgi:hypothetical protein
LILGSHEKAGECRLSCARADAQQRSQPTRSADTRSNAPIGAGCIQNRRQAGVLQVDGPTACGAINAVHAGQSA